MHPPQCVEKLENELRFLIKEKALTLKDFDKIWESQLGKHEAIEKNVHDLLSMLAWDFTPEQLDHLFSCFEVYHLTIQIERLSHDKKRYLEFQRFNYFVEELDECVEKSARKASRFDSFFVRRRQRRRNGEQSVRFTVEPCT